MTEIIRKKHTGETTDNPGQFGSVPKLEATTDAGLVSADQLTHVEENIAALLVSDYTSMSDFEDFTSYYGYEFNDQVSTVSTAMYEYYNRDINHFTCSPETDPDGGISGYNVGAYIGQGQYVTSFLETKYATDDRDATGVKQAASIASALDYEYKKVLKRLDGGIRSGDTQLRTPSVEDATERLTAAQYEVKKAAKYLDEQKRLAADTKPVPDTTEE